MNFAKKVIIVTGASSGIGADAAKHLAKLGGKVCLVARSENLLKSVAEEIESFGSLEKPLIITADVTKDAERIIGETVNHFGKLDVLVNNAGIYQINSINKFDIAHLDNIFNTNLRSVAILTSLAVPHLEKTKGNIVNVSSIAGIKSFAGHISYGVSKAALDQFTKCAALDLAPKGIRVNAINPTLIRTLILEKAGMSPDLAAKTMEANKAVHPLGRIGETADTSAAIAFLASDSASFITGVLLPVDGGYAVK